MRKLQQVIQLFGEQLTLLELTGTLFGIAGVWLTVKENIFCFPVGIVNVTLYAWLFFQTRLYADAFLQIIYILLLIYGWYQWLHGNKKDHRLAITKTNGKTLAALFGFGILASVAAGTFFRYNTNASLPYVDSLTTSMSLIAQWLVARKKIENWLVWIVADVIYVGMYINKHLYFTSMLYFIFILLAITGWQRWKKERMADVAK